MKQLLITIAAVVLVGCGESQQSASAPEAKPAEPSEPVAEAAKPEPPPVKAPDNSIHDAVEKGNIEAVKQHIAAGTDVNAKGGLIGGTPLYCAVAFGNKEIVELLIANGADVNAKEVDDLTPLDWTAHPDSPNANAEIADLLRKHGGKTKKELEAESK